MKKRNLFLGLAIIVIGFTSCKDEKETQAQKSVETYVVYVDSLGNVAAADAETNWEAIEAALEDLEDKEAAQERINASKVKYDALKAKIVTEKVDNVAVVSSKQKLRNALFGQGKIGEDLSFTWVNASNIHGVYQQFVHSVEDNKNNYSREDWDEVKIMYEALDSRKNTVEKEGLSSEDNRKIAGLKAKFGPMYTVNRMGAKSDEMESAKE